jgi:Flp pilus assembly protein TadG
LNRAARRGQTLVEFALVIPLLFLLFVNVVNFAGFFFAWITVANAARAGSQYAVLGGASVGAPEEPTATQIYNLVTQDVTSLINRQSLVVRLCRQSSSALTCSTSGSGTFTNPPADTSTEANLYVRAWVDAHYNYVPLIPLYQFPGLGVYLTLPPTMVRRQAVMRMIQ